MPFDAATIGLVEDVLSECFKFHSALDAFLIRSGVSPKLLATARARAEKRTAEVGRFPKAPKRIVVQELLDEIGHHGEADNLIAAILTGLTKSTFRDATSAGLQALVELKAKVAADKKEIDERRNAEQEQHARLVRAAEQALEAKRADREARQDELRDRFLALQTESDPQRRGYLLENFLNDLFEYEGLDPRRSFKITGEQIDGSFAWRNKTYLVEAKWVNKPVAGAEFGPFHFKIEGKSADTRGLYISINGYSPQAIKGMNGKGALKFVCIDGAHIMRALISNEGLDPILQKVWRHADETGESYLPVLKLGT